MLNDRTGVDKHSENFNKEMGNIRKYQIKVRVKTYHNWIEKYTRGIDNRWEEEESVNSKTKQWINQSEWQNEKGIL